MEYNPKWIVISNDDMYKIDDVSILKGQLENIDPDKFYIVFPAGTHYHTVKSRFSCFMDFGIFSASYVKSLSCKLFDESFINAYEDHDISLKFYLQHLNYAVINYRIGDYIGSSLGTGIHRELRNIASLSYLNYKFEK